MKSYFLILLALNIVLGNLNLKKSNYLIQSENSNFLQLYTNKLITNTDEDDVNLSFEEIVTKKSINIYKRF